MLAGRENNGTALPVRAAHINLMMGQLHARIAPMEKFPTRQLSPVYTIQQASTWQTTGLSACGVWQAHTLSWAAAQSPTVTAMLAGQA